MYGSRASNAYGKGGTENATGLSSNLRLASYFAGLPAASKPAAAWSGRKNAAPAILPANRNSLRFTRNSSARWADPVYTADYMPRRSYTQLTGRLLAPPERLPSPWMRESAQRADSAITASGDSDNFLSDFKASGYAEFPAVNPELPSAMQALRTNPLHLARLTGLPRNFSRKSSSLRFASINSSGRKSEFSVAVLSKRVASFR